MLNFDGTGFLKLPARIINAMPCSILIAGTRTDSSGGQFWAHQSTGSADRAMGLSHGDSSDGKFGEYATPGGNNINVGTTGAPNTSATIPRWMVLNLYGVNDIEIMFGTSSNVLRSTTGLVTGDVTNLHDTVTLGARFINGGAREFMKGALGEAHFFSNVYTASMLNALIAGTVKPEEQSNWIDGVTLKDFQSSGNYVSIGGTRTFVATGGVTASAISHPVSRTTPDTTSPTVSSAAVSNSTPTVVNLTMSEAMDTGNVPAASAFTISGHTVSSVAITGSTINLTVSAAFVNGEAARTVAYTQPGTANARDVAGNLLASFTGQAITNNVAATDTTAPTFSSAQVANAAPANIVITMSETLAAFTPAASAFAVSGGKTVSSVARSGATITLTCSAAYAFGDTITVTYTKPGTNMLQDAAGNQTASFGPSAVTNNISSGASVTITSPAQGGKRVADGAYRASVACNVTALDKTTHAVLERKTGLTSPASGPLVFTSTVLAAGTERLFLVKADADDKDIGMFFATPV